MVQNFSWVKLWRINHFRVLARENVGKFTLATLVNLEFGWVNIGEWRLVHQIRQSFPPPKNSALYTVLYGAVWYSKTSKHRIYNPEALDVAPE